MGRLGIKGKEKEAGRPLHQRPSSTPSMKQRESNSDVGRDYKFSKSTPNDTNTILPKPPQMAHQLETKFSSIRGNGLIQTHTSSLLWTPSGSKRCLNGALYLVIQPGENSSPAFWLPANSECSGLHAPIPNYLVTPWIPWSLASNPPRLQQFSSEEKSLRLTGFSITHWTKEK